jgi:hypothetical protein
MWRPNGKTTTLVLFLDSLFQKFGRGYEPVARQTFTPSVIQTILESNWKY